MRLLGCDQPDTLSRGYYSRAGSLVSGKQHGTSSQKVDTSGNQTLTQPMSLSAIHTHSTKRTHLFKRENMSFSRLESQRPNVDTRTRVSSAVTIHRIFFFCIGAGWHGFR